MDKVLLDVKESKKIRYLIDKLLEDLKMQLENCSNPNVFHNRRKFKAFLCDYQEIRNL